MTHLEALINHWQAQLRQSDYLLSISAKLIIQTTILYLEELQHLKEGKSSH